MEWDAPESCPGALDVYARLSSLLGHEPEALGRLSRVRGSVVRTASGYRLVLEASADGRRSSRSFEAAICTDLADAAALAIALAMAPPATGAAETSPASAPVAPHASAAASSPRDEDAEGTPSRAEVWRVRGFASASALIEYGALPRPAPGVAIGGGARIGAASLGAYGALLGSQLESVASAQNVQFALWFAGLRACYPLLERTLELEACASFEAGRFGAQGIGLQPARESDDPWIAVGGAVAARWLLTGALGIELRAEPMLPLLRKEYTVNGSSDVHAPAPLSSRVYLGLTLLGG